MEWRRKRREEKGVLIHALPLAVKSPVERTVQVRVTRKLQAAWSRVDSNHIVKRGTWLGLYMHNRDTEHRRRRVVNAARPRETRKTSAGHSTSRDRVEILDSS